jgi:hypothetical protein
MTVNVGDIFRVTARFKNTKSGDIVNVYHVSIFGGSAVADFDFVSDVEDWLTSLYVNVATSLGADTDPYDLRIDQVELSGGVEQVIRNVVTKSWVLGTPPSSSGDQLPSTDAAIVNFRTIYPRVFGRKYLGCIPEGSQDAGTLISGTLTAIAAFAADVVAVYIGTYVSLESGVLTIKAGAGNNYWAPFLGYVANAILGNQRRRRKNRGS